jgi:hypothetical protein
MNSSLISKIIKTGLLVGTFDILAAFIDVYIKSGKFIPLRILRFIAGGIFGKDASNGGMVMALAGLVFHYLFALLFTAVFFWIFPKFKFAAKNKIITGVVYGVFIWAVMNLVVLPLSKIPAGPINISSAAIDSLILVICIGIPLAFIVAKWYKSNTQTSK